MIRRMLVRPDEMFRTREGEEFPCVSREKMQTAMMELEGILAMNGGVAAIDTRRYPTGFEHEMVTVLAMIEWKDAPVARPAREPVAQDVVAPGVEEVDQREFEEAAAAAPPAASSDSSPSDEASESEPALAGAHDDRAIVEFDDTAAVLDRHGKPEEDLGAIPGAQRALVA